MGYADEDVIQNMVKTTYNALNPTDYSSLSSQAIENADDYVIISLEENNIIPPDTNDTLTKAANYFAAAEILDAYHAAKDSRSPTATVYEEKGNKILEKYIAIYENTYDTTPYRTVGTFAYDKDYLDG